MQIVAETSWNYLFAPSLSEKVLTIFARKNSSSSENMHPNFIPLGKCFCQNCKSLKIWACNKSASKALQDILVPNFWQRAVLCASEELI